MWCSIRFSNQTKQMEEQLGLLHPVLRFFVAAAVGMCFGGPGNLRIDYGDGHVESPWWREGIFWWHRPLAYGIDVSKGCLLFMLGVCFSWSKIVEWSIPKASTKKRSEFSRNTRTHGRPHGFFKIASEIDTGTLPPNGRKHWRFLKKWRFSWSQDFFWNVA